MRVKVCGITNLYDALLASELGAYAIGFVFYRKSKRYVREEIVKEIVRALPPFVLKVGVFVEEDEERILKLKESLSLDRVQVYKDVRIESSSVIRALRIKGKEDLKMVEETPFFPLLDSYSQGFGGSGKSFDWSLLKEVKRPYILAGGINIDNLEEVMKIKPYAIDVSTGLEKMPGKKDEKKMKEFFKRIREYEE